MNEQVGNTLSEESSEMTKILEEPKAFEQTNPNQPVPSTPEIDEEELFLSHFKLDLLTLTNTQGKSILTTFPEILQAIDLPEENLTLYRRILLTERLLLWYSLITPTEGKPLTIKKEGEEEEAEVEGSSGREEIKKRVFEVYCNRFLDLVKFSFIAPDHPAVTFPSPPSSSGHISREKSAENDRKEADESIRSIIPLPQKIGYNISLLLENYCSDYPVYKESLQAALMKVILFMLSKQMPLEEPMTLTALEQQRKKKERLRRRRRKINEEKEIAKEGGGKGVDGEEKTDVEETTEDEVVFQENSAILRVKTLKLLLRCLPEIGKRPIFFEIIFCHH